MQIEAHILAWNREDTIAFTIKHYQSFCSEVTIYDNYSTDRTREIAESLGADVVTFGREGVLDDAEYIAIKNNCWKGSDADWVIVVDDDEILSGYYISVTNQLKLAQDSGATIIKPQGFNIYSNIMPKETWLELKKGILDDNYSKLCCFNPKAIKDIGYIYGCHDARPKGRVRIVEKLWLLHYRAVGGVERLIDRHHEYEPRRQKSQINMRWDLGKHYRQSVEYPDLVRQEFKECLERSVPFYEAGQPL
jgi:glycosyltransferase involved in cell wall biosynthesis